MKIEDFYKYKEVESLNGKIGMWKIAIGELNMSDFILGCYFDNSSGLWKVYINNERGRHRVRLQTESEEEAFDELLSIINFEIENNEYAKSVDRMDGK